MGGSGCCTLRGPLACQCRQSDPELDIGREGPGPGHRFRWSDRIMQLHSCAGSTSPVTVLEDSGSAGAGRWRAAACGGLLRPVTVRNGCLSRSFSIERHAPRPQLTVLSNELRCRDWIMQVAE